MSIEKEFLFRSIKIFDIGFVTVIYFLVGITLAKLFDSLYGIFDENKESKKSKLMQTIELMLMMWMYGVIIYVVRNVVEIMTSPFDGIGGFQHHRLKELKSAPVFVFIFLYFQKYFLAKLKYYYTNILK